MIFNIKIFNSFPIITLNCFILVLLPLSFFIFINTNRRFCVLHGYCLEVIYSSVKEYCQHSCVGFVFFNFIDLSYQFKEHLGESLEISAAGKYSFPHSIPVKYVRSAL